MEGGKGRHHMMASNLELQLGEKQVIIEGKRNKNDLELSFLTVLAFPNASKSGFD